MASRGRRYVVLLGVVSTLISIDSFCRSVGAPPHPLPVPQPGEPRRQRPRAARREEAWVAMLPSGRPTGAESDMWGERTNVIRALSLVPDEVRGLQDLSQAHYLSFREMSDLTRGRGSLDRRQVELVAGRVSALRECFYWTTAHTLLLRASSEIIGAEVDLRAVTDPSTSSGVAHGERLLAFAEALVGEDDDALAGEREALCAELGPEGLVDAAAVASNFERMVRIADGTGIPLDAPVRLLASDLPDALAISLFRSAANTPAPTLPKRLLGRALQPFARVALRLVFRRARA